MSIQYLAIDGDDVGHQLEYFVMTNQTQQLADFFITFQSAMSWLEDKLTKELGGTIIFNGGDNLLACLPSVSCSPEMLEQLRDDFAKLARKTLSVGVGRSSRQAYFALKLAKSSGKNRVERFEELAGD
jgi:GTP cyclohydrolase III